MIVLCACDANELLTSVSPPRLLLVSNTVIDGPLSKKFFTETAKVEDQGGEAAILLEEEMSTWPFTATEGATAALLSLCSENRVSPPPSLLYDIVARAQSELTTCSSSAVSCRRT